MFYKQLIVTSVVKATPYTVSMNIAPPTASERGRVTPHQMASINMKREIVFRLLKRTIVSRVSRRMRHNGLLRKRTTRTTKRRSIDQRRNCATISKLPLSCASARNSKHIPGYCTTTIYPVRNKVCNYVC